MLTSNIETESNNRIERFVLAARLTERNSLNNKVVVMAIRKVGFGICLIHKDKHESIEAAAFSGVFLSERSSEDLTVKPSGLRNKKVRSFEARWA